MGAALSPFSWTSFTENSFQSVSLNREGCDDGVITAAIEEVMIMRLTFVLDMEVVLSIRISGGLKYRFYDIPMLQNAIQNANSSLNSWSNKFWNKSIVLVRGSVHKLLLCIGTWYALPSAVVTLRWKGEAVWAIASTPFTASSKAPSYTITC